MFGGANHQRGVCASIPNGIYTDVCSFSGGGTNTPQTYCTEITKRSGAVYKVCCEGGEPTQVHGGFYDCNSPCTGNCTETLISE